MKSVVASNLADSVMSGVSPEAQADRLSVIATSPNPAKRLIKLGLHQMADRLPRVAAHCLGFDMEMATGLSYVGAGHDAIVFLRPDNTVIKIHSQTAYFSAEQKADFVAQRQVRHDKMAAYLGPLALPQLTFVDSHPFANNIAVIQTVQAYADVQKPHLFMPHMGGLDTYGIGRYLETQQNSLVDLTTLASDSLRLYADHTLLPDVGSDDNLLIDGTTQHLILVDGHPFGGEDATTQEKIAGHLHQLEAILKLAA
jgi:hypothetical protein